MLASRTPIVATQLSSSADAAAAARTGVLYALAAYGLWGIFPVYFKWVSHIRADEILAHRIVWSVGFCALLLTWTGRWPNVAAIVRSKRAWAALSVSAVLVAINWLCFIYAVVTDRILEASLGYFINPLVSIVLGMVFLGERLRPMQWLAVAFAAGGVVYLTTQEGLPWIAITVAVTFGLYGLVRKQAKPGPLAGLFFETLLLAPIAAVYMLWLWTASADGLVFATGAWDDRGLLLCAGVLTTLPLLYFAAAAKRLPLSTLGFFQYIAPTAQFAAGLFYGEPFSTERAIAFALIWIGIAIFIVESWRRAQQSSHRSAQTPGPRR
ncbi:MAG: EamA family transporter RarD [Planctomycetota bacterium]